MEKWGSAAFVIGFGVVSSLLIAGNAFSMFFYPVEMAQNAISPIDEAERGELDFLSCLEEEGKFLESGSITTVLVSDQVFDSPSRSYLYQRLDEILYPRIRINDELAETEFHVKHLSEVTFGPSASSRENDILYQSQCASVAIEIRERETNE